MKRLLQEAAVRPEQVELEITESAMLVDPERAKHIVKELHGLGVLIAIDDYGTGSRRSATCATCASTR